jgi:LPXTG-motif cell wall-anchored protein
VIISGIITFALKLSILESLRIVFGSVFVLFLPGFIISYIFFPKTREFEENKGKREEREKGAIDWIERVALSFALSIAIVPLAVFYLNLIGVKINLLNSFLTILGILVISGVILFYRNRRK